MGKRRPDGRNALESGRDAAASVYPALSRGALRLRSALLGRSGTETVGPPSLVTLELNAGRGFEADGTKSGRDGKAGALERFFRARSGPSKSDWLGIVNGVAAGTTLRLAGGDPLESPHLEVILFDADRRGIDVEIVTPGARLEECAPVIYGLGVARLRLVLYGPEEVHNRTTGDARAFERAVRGALAMRGLRCGTARPTLVVDVVTSAESVSSAVETVECALAMGADGVVAHWPRPGEGVLDLGAVLMLCKARTKWRGEVVRFFPDLGEDELRRYYGGEALSVGPKRCLVPWRSVTVGADGKVRFCGTTTVGDMGREALADVCNSEAARLLRRELKKGPAAECAGCPGRFGDEGLVR